MSGRSSSVTTNHGCETRSTAFASCALATTLVAQRARSAPARRSALATSGSTKRATGSEATIGARCTPVAFALRRSRGIIRPTLGKKHAPAYDVFDFTGKEEEQRAQALWNWLIPEPHLVALQALLHSSSLYTPK